LSSFELGNRLPITAENTPFSVSPPIPAPLLTLRQCVNQASSVLFGAIARNSVIGRST
jgi:hypothetical protein